MKTFHIHSKTKPNNFIHEIINVQRKSAINLKLEFFYNTKQNNEKRMQSLWMVESMFNKHCSGKIPSPIFGLLFVYLVQSALALAYSSFVCSNEIKEIISTFRSFSIEYIYQFFLRHTGWFGHICSHIFRFVGKFAWVWHTTNTWHWWHTTSARNFWHRWHLRHSRAQFAHKQN